MIRRLEGGVEKGLVQVDRSHKQHLYEMYCLQMQMAEREEETRERQVLAQHRWIAFLVSGSIFTVWLSAFVNIHTRTQSCTCSHAVWNYGNVAVDSRSLSELSSLALPSLPALLSSLFWSKRRLWKVNSQPAVDKLCVTCLVVLPYMETGVSEYSGALPRRKGEREREKKRGSEVKGGKGGRGGGEGGGGRKRGRGGRKWRKKGGRSGQCREASMRFSLSILPSAAVRWVFAEIQ